MTMQSLLRINRTMPDVTPPHRDILPRSKVFDANGMPH